MVLLDLFDNKEEETPVVSIQNTKGSSNRVMIVIYWQ